MITTAICAVTALISMMAFSQESVFQKLMHHPYTEIRQKEYWRWLTSGFVHADYMHLAFNLFAFYSFGKFVEFEFMDKFGDKTGQMIYLVFYLAIIVAANIPTHFQQKNNVNYMAVGASGGVSGVVFAAILFRPWLDMAFFFFPMKGLVFGVLYILYSSWAAKNANNNIGHSAHLTGAIMGFLLTALLMPSEFEQFLISIRYESPYW